MVILEFPRRYVGLQIARFRLRKSREKVISFTESITAARHALLVMPFERAQLLPTVMVLDMLKKKFREENITVVTAAQSAEAVRFLPRARFVRVLPKDLSLFFLPRKSLLQLLAKREYDVSIDLNLDLVLPSGYICKESKARVRIGFAGRGADTFFNFQVQPDPTKEKRMIYDRLAKFLQMF
jgi:ADP-heptose:LPS heptosyltransferase